MVISFAVTKTSPIITNALRENVEGRGERRETTEGKSRDGLRTEGECQSLGNLSSLPPLIRVKNVLPSVYRSLTPTSEKKRWCKGKREGKVYVRVCVCVYAGVP